MSDTCAVKTCGAPLDALTTHIAHDESCPGGDDCGCDTEVCEQCCPTCNPAVDLTAYTEGTTP